jgi:Ca-activated chloride channel family protein
LAIPWTELKVGRDVEAFAERVASVEIPQFGRWGTAIGNSLRSAREVLSLGPQDCARTVIDISGDGGANAGIDTASEADSLAAADISINGLVLPGDLMDGDEDPLAFYLLNVVRGPNSFLMDVSSAADFPAAMENKLLRELSRQVALSDPN